jgi:hypothetical protein
LLLNLKFSFIQCIVSMIQHQQAKC